MVVEEFRPQESKAPFNMAINTLERLGEILREIKNVSRDFNFTLDVRQAMKVQLVKQFYMQSSPLLEPDVAAKYLERFKSIQPNCKKVIESRSGSFKQTNDIKNIYSSNLDLEMDLFMLDIQRELQKEKYFMPPKKDMGSVVGRF